MHALQKVKNLQLSYFLQLVDRLISNIVWHFHVEAFQDRTESGVHERCFLNKSLFTFIAVAKGPLMSTYYAAKARQHMHSQRVKNWRLSHF